MTSGSQHTGAGAEWQDAGSQFPPGQFPPHGQSIVRLEGSLLFYEHTGPFNAEFFKGLAALRLRLRESGKLPNPYAAIVKFHGSVLMTPEALEAYRASSRGAGNVPVAYVIPAEAEGRVLMMPALLELWRNREGETAVFESTQDAILWARSRLEEIRSRLPGRL